MPPSVRTAAGSPRASWAPGRRFARGLIVGLAFASAMSAPAFGQRVRVSSLTDLSFGTLASVQSDHRQSQSICVYSNGQTSGYSISAWGSGSAGAFELSNGPNTLHYDVEWSPVSGQTAGTNLVANVPLTGQVSGAGHQTCNNGPATSASLIVILRGVDLSQAREGNYTGSLSLLISAE
jgi:spore coat protein U-like protein